MNIDWLTLLAVFGVGMVSGMWLVLQTWEGPKDKQS
jgi:hypothetical protein